MKEQFKEFHNRKISDKVCDIHQVNYWEISIPVGREFRKKNTTILPRVCEGGD